MNISRLGHLDAVTHLLKAGAKKDLVNVDGQTALDLARNKNLTEIADYLEYFGTFQYRLERIGVSSEDVPLNFKCPISLEIMNDPIILPSGIAIDRKSMRDYFAKRKEEGHGSSGFCPVTRKPITAEVLLFGTAVFVKESLENYVQGKEKEAAIKARKISAIQPSPSLMRSKSIDSFFSAQEVMVKPDEDLGKDDERSNLTFPSPRTPRPCGQPTRGK